MNKTTLRIGLLINFLFLTACAQQTKFSYELCADEQTVCKLSFDDGKGRKFVHVEIKSTTGTTLKYIATDVDASARAAIVADALKDMLPDIAAAAIKAVKP